MLHLTGESGVLVSGLLMMSSSSPPLFCSFSPSSSQQFSLLSAAGEDGSKENLFLTMDMGVEHDVLSGGLGEKHSGQRSGSNHSLPKESSVLCFVRAAEGREEKKVSVPHQKPRRVFDSRPAQLSPWATSSPSPQLPQFEVFTDT